MKKRGFISIIGYPNTGKSTLLNALIGQKVSIVSPKAQTTRDKIIGILTRENYQMVFLDTPGILNPKSKLGHFMVKEIKKAAADADVIVFVLDATRRLKDGEVEALEKYLQKGKSKILTPIIVAVNKIDEAGFNKTYPLIDKIKSLLIETETHNAIKEIVPISAYALENIDKLEQFISLYLEEGEFFYPEDEITDKPIKFIVAETIREKALLFLQDEIPHGLGCMVQKMYTEGKLTTIEADIVCEKDTHKPIIIGKDGEKLKQIATSARLEIEKLLEKKVFLSLFVKVREGWRDKSNYLSDLGYQDK